MNGLVTLKSAYDFPITVARLKAALDEAKIRLFAVIDHAAGAAEAGLQLRPTTLLIFGNPRSGTPLMQQQQTMGLDLPLKALVWEDESGNVHLTYCEPRRLADERGLGPKSHEAVAVLSAAMKSIAEQTVMPLTHS